MMAGGSTKTNDMNVRQMTNGESAVVPASNLGVQNFMPPRHDVEHETCVRRTPDRGELPHVRKDVFRRARASLSETPWVMPSSTNFRNSRETKFTPSDDRPILEDTAKDHANAKRPEH